MCILGRASHVVRRYMAKMLADCKAILSPGADYSPQLLPIMNKKK